MTELTYYIKNKKVVALSYQSGLDGFIFSEGTLFKNRCPSIMGNGFATNKMTRCKSQSDMTRCIKELDKRLTTRFSSSPIEQIVVTSNLYSKEYRDFREKYGT